MTISTFSSDIARGVSRDGGKVADAESPAPLTAGWQAAKKRGGILADNAAPKIASRDEVLEMLTEKARQGYTGAMIALERALRAAERKEREVLDNELDRILTK